MIEGRIIGPIAPTIGGVYPRMADRPRAAAAQDASASGHAPSTALIQTAPVRQQEAPPAAARRMSAAFVAQLIATDGNFPQTRDRRRADPGDAANAYAEASRLVSRSRRS